MNFFYHPKNSLLFFFVFFICIFSLTCFPFGLYSDYGNKGCYYYYIMINQWALFCLSKTSFRTRHTSSPWSVRFWITTDFNSCQFCKYLNSSRNHCKAYYEVTVPIIYDFEYIHTVERSWVVRCYETWNKSFNNWIDILQYVVEKCVERKILWEIWLFSCGKKPWLGRSFLEGYSWRLNSTDLDGE